MKNLIFLSTLFLFSTVGYSQKDKGRQKISLPGLTDSVKGVVVKERAGYLSLPRTNKPIGQFKIVYSIDTATQSLLYVAHIEKLEKQHFTLFYFNNNKLAQVVKGETVNRASFVNNSYTYTEDENEVGGSYLNDLSESSEKFDLLRKARMHLQVLEKDTTL